MKRRDFIGVLLALPGAILIDKGTRVTIGAREWLYLKLCEWREIVGTDRSVCYLVGLRSDGNWFHVCVPEWTADVKNPQIVRAAEENARNALDTFLDCSCGPNGQCVLHETMFPKNLTDEELADAAV